MDIAVALNRRNRRDLRMNVGDNEQINVTVYAVDGDETPLAFTNARINSWPSSLASIPVGTAFTVSDSWPRMSYTLSVEIDGKRRTVAYGVIVVDGAHGWPYSGNDYGGVFGWGIWP